MLKPDFNSKSMFSKLNIYLVLKANFNSKFMFSKLNIQFTEHSVYRTLLYLVSCHCHTLLGLRRFKGANFVLLISFLRGFKNWKSMYNVKKCSCAILRFLIPKSIIYKTESANLMHNKNCSNIDYTAVFI